MTKSDILEAIARSVETKTRLVMSNLNLHGMALMFSSSSMCSLNSAKESLIMIDGMPIIWISKLLGLKLSRQHRMTSLDYFDDLFTIASAKSWKIDYVGSTPEVLDKGIKLLKQRFPKLDIDGKHGYFDIDDKSSTGRQGEILQWLKNRNSDILIVGMGMPRQEEWIESIKATTPHSALIPVGAYLEYQVGSLKLPPRWMGQLGIEWLFRLITAPRRLAYRYLVEPFILVALLIFKKHPQDLYWKSKVKS